MDPALRARVGASDVLQEAWLDVRARIDDWLRDPSMPFYVWVRFLAAQRLLKARRHHLGAKRRDVRRQAPDRPGTSGLEATAAGLVEGLAASATSASGVVARHELRQELHAALDAMEPMDREVLALRHFEGLSNADTAAMLGIQPDAASKRYLRALERLRDVLSPGADAP